MKRRTTKGGLRLGVLAPLTMVSVAALSGACGSTPTDEGTGTADVTSAADFFGDDRVGAVLKTNVGSIPSNYLEYEKVFKVGRECARTNSKEIFIVEEKKSRSIDGANNKEFAGLLPRAIITGCNTTGDVRQSYTLMAALISDPEVPKFEGRTDKNDVMSFTPLEVTAFDNKTGLQNWYVFEPTTKGKPGKVTRIFRDNKGGVLQRTLLPTGKVSADVPANVDGKPSARCFGCHVNGAPLMNELHEPWTNWVSSRSQATQGVLAGETKSIVNEAIPNAAAPGRSSLANELEQIINQATQAYVSGNGQPGHGWGPSFVKGTLPGGVRTLLRSAFCETELNYESSREVIPIELFFDSDATASVGLTEPDAVAGLTFPFLFPIRSQLDKSTENFLGSAQILRNATLQVLRLIDDENEIFSPMRCNLLTEFTPQIPALDKMQTLDDFKKFDGLLTAFLVDKLKTGKFPWASAPDLFNGGACDLTKPPDTVKPETNCPPTATRQYARAHFVNELLRENVRREKSLRAYGVEVTTRFEAKKAEFGTSRKTFETKDAFRKTEAAKLFKCSAGKATCGPMPDLK